MRKFLFWLLAILIVLVAGLVYLLYAEGAFETAPKQDTSLQPFPAMKCEAGKCGGAK